MSTHPAALPESELLAQVEELRSRGSGPGGQRRNKVQTQVRLRHRPTGIVVLAGERRSLARNQRAALWRLRLALALEHRELRLTQREPRTAGPSGAGGGEEAVPSELWRRRTMGPSLGVAPGHADVPALLAEALDVLAGCEDDLTAAARILDVSRSRLLRVLRLQPVALDALNRRLAAAGRPTWH